MGELDLGRDAGRAGELSCPLPRFILLVWGLCWRWSLCPVGRHEAVNDIGRGRRAGRGRVVLLTARGVLGEVLAGPVSSRWVWLRGAGLPGREAPVSWKPGGAWPFITDWRYK